MTIRAIFTKTARDDRCKKSKNKVFKRFNMLKSVNNEREREREKSRPNTAPFSLCPQAPPTFAVLCHATLHAKFLPQTQDASTATLKGVVLR